MVWDWLLGSFDISVLGPLIVYGVHTRVINIAQKNYNLPNTLIAKLQTNIMIDLLITFPR